MIQAKEKNIHTLATEVGLYKNAYDKAGQTITLQAFLDGVKNGRWKDQVEEIREMVAQGCSKPALGKLKAKLPCVTISGMFENGERNDNALVEHSGFVCVDFDDLKDVETTRKILENDPYTYACFKSASGKGLAVIVKIEPTNDPIKHKELFVMLERYYNDKYGFYF